VEEEYLEEGPLVEAVLEPGAAIPVPHADEAA
jgi:hypothetical protein